MSRGLVKIGRPLKFQSVKELQKQIDSYFDGCEASGEPVTVTGLCLALDTSRETVCDYQEKDAFSDTINRAKMRCMNYAEKQLYLARSANGPIFALKNFGWTDRREVDVSSGEVRYEIPIEVKRLTE